MTGDSVGKTRLVFQKSTSRAVGFGLQPFFLLPKPRATYLISLMISARSFGASTGALLNCPWLSLW